MMGEPKRLRVLLADDHVLFRRGVRAEMSFYPQIEVVGEVGNGCEAVARARECNPDVILMDISMPGSCGLEALVRIKKEMPDVRVIILTVHDDDQHLFEAIQKGADGYLLKNVEPLELIEMLDKVHRGEAAIVGKLAARVFHRFRSPENAPAPSEEPIEPLTSREVEVLKLVIEGDTNAEIAEKLVISANTVKMHLGNILNKLHLQNRIQAAVYAVREDIIRIPS
jgi:DNA-binding NarL/FixJ family response regulator